MSSFGEDLLTIDSLARFCQESLPLPEVTVDGLRQIASGWESDIWAFKLSAQGEQRDVVVRLYPGRWAAEKASRESGVMRWLHGLGYPVPEVLAVERSASRLGHPFILMELIEGQTMGPVIGHAPFSQRRDLIGQFCGPLAALHALDWRSLPADVLPRQPSESVSAWVDSLMRQAGDSLSEDFLPAFEWARSHLAEVEPAQLSLIHWDYHPSNVLYRSDGSVSVIDWTSAEVADYRLDLAWTLLLMGMYDGWARREAVLREYERLRGCQVRGIEVFEAVAALRRLFSIIVSLSSGAQTLGMRPGAEAQMRSSLGHVESVYELFFHRTGVGLPSVERLLYPLRRG